jgi:RNA polymerase sigma factor (sigma-70 family)
MSYGQLGNTLRQLLGTPAEETLTDGQLLECFLAQHDEAAFSSLVHRHGPMVLGVCRRVLRDDHAADDAFQATFLVLVRKAGSIGKRESVGTWLYRVAFHLALRARSSASRRRDQERQVEDMANLPGKAEPSWNDVRPVIDEELNRLPEKYRAPVVLCYFEGKTNEEAARHLHWPMGTVQGRLARARELLRERLAGRGLALSAAALSVGLGEATASATVPAPLVRATFQAALGFMAGSAAGSTSLPATLLAQGMLKTMFISKLKVAAVLIMIGAVVAMGIGVVTHRAQAEKSTVKSLSIDNPGLQFAKYYEPVKITAQPRVPAYKLPLDLSQVSNYEEAAKKLGLPADEPSLKANGFAVLPGKNNEDIVAPYKDLKVRGVPVFVTADTLLHLYHVQFDETLKDIEERAFYPDIVALTEALTNRLAAAGPPGDGENFREAQRKALTYLAIALKSLKPEATLPKQVPQKDVDLVLDKMEKHEGFWPDPDAASTEWPLFRYAEDFSQYVPRGHYTRSPELKRYFVGMMWLGRLAFILKGDPSYGPNDQPALVSVAEANQQTIAAALIVKLLAETELADKRRARAVWERIYAVTSFYVGLADDLGLQEYEACLKKVSGAAFDVSALGTDQKLLELKGELAKYNPPAIYSGTGGQGTFDPKAGPEKLVAMLDKTMGFRFMGQRFVPDSHMMGKLVFPAVGEPTRDGMFTLVVGGNGPLRGFPRGLDVMSVLGSKRARTLVTELGDDAYQHGRRGTGDALSYNEALDALQKEYAELTDRDWNRNLYWSWLHALKPLLAEFGEGYPTFMTTKAYQNKSLNTALASWAQLRHDTILYAKQSYTAADRGAPPRPKPVQGYVEPIPEFYARLLTLARMTNRGLDQLKVLNADAKKRLDEFEKLLVRLLAIAEKELANEELKDDDYAFIRDFGEHLQGVTVALNRQRIDALQQEAEKARKAGNNKRWQELLEQLGAEQAGAMKTTIVADVHTDQNTKQVLEEGTGYVDLGVFVYRQPDGRLVLGAGPVLSYYEFKQPMANRLTDEKWRDLLKTAGPAQPEWTKPYLSSKGRYDCRWHD